MSQNITSHIFPFGTSVQSQNVTVNTHDLRVIKEKHCIEVHGAYISL